jgi:hypothetical protein
MYDLKMVDKISHSGIRNIFLKHGTKWRKSKTDLSNKSNDPAEYALKKIHLTTAKVQHTFIRFGVTVCG